MPDLIKEFGSLAAIKAAQDARVAALPQKPEDYKLEVPADFKVPDGWVIDDKDARVAPLRQLMHDIDQGKVSGQEAFSRLFAIEAKKEIDADARYRELAEAEQTKLGANGPARVTSVKTSLSPVIGPDVLAMWLGDDKNPGLLPRAVDLEALEKIQRAISSQGAASYSGNGRAPPAPPTKTMEERWYSESTTQRKAS